MSRQAQGVKSPAPERPLKTVPGRHRSIRGGLDNAVKYADDHGLRDLFIVDVDCHQLEPFKDFAKYMDEPWRGIFGQSDLTFDYDADPFFGERSEGLGRLNQKKIDRNLSGRIQRPELKAYAKQYVTDPAKMVAMLERNFSAEDLIDVFVKRFDDIGIKRCIIFPNWMLKLGWDPRPEFEVAVCEAYLDYMLDKVLGKHPELLSVLCIPANSPEKSAELIERAGSEKGIVGVGITANRPNLAGDPSWDPIYEAAQKKGLPMCFHAGTYLGGPFAGFDKYLPIHALTFPFYLALQLTSIVTEGVPERFPRVKHVFMEGGISWIPWMAHRLDNEYLMRESEAPLLTKLPSEYIRDFYYSSQPIEHPVNAKDLEWMLQTFDGENRLMYASDYPHQDFDAPSSIWDIPFLTKEAKKKILGENAAKLFKIS